VPICRHNTHNTPGVLKCHRVSLPVVVRSSSSSNNNLRKQMIFYCEIRGQCARRSLPPRREVSWCRRRRSSHVDRPHPIARKLSRVFRTFTGAVITRDVARAYGKTKPYERSRCDRKKIEMLKRILGLDRLRLRGPGGAQFEFTLAVIGRGLTAEAPFNLPERPSNPRHPGSRAHSFLQQNRPFSGAPGPAQ
jgi:hypothetical protein